jgi:hypothetical protein
MPEALQSASIENVLTYKMTAREQAIVEESMKDYKECQTYRATHAGQWEEIAEIADPNSKNTFYPGNYNYPGQKKTERQIDSTAMLAGEKFKAILDSLLTPRNMYWHGLEADNQYLMKQRNVRLWYEQATKALFRQRYLPHANFASQNQGVYHNLCFYGTGGLFIDSLFSYDGTRGLRYRCPSLGEIFIKENHQGMPCGYIRFFRLTAEQAKTQFPDNFPQQMQAALDAKSQAVFDFIQRVVPRVDYDRERIDAKGKPWASYYIFLQGQILLSEGGYNTFPMPISRYIQAPMETYGRGPAGQVLPTLKTLNAQKRVFLKQGHRASDPILLTADDGLGDFNLRPGSMNKGYMSLDGKPLVGILPTGQIAINEKMMDAEKAIIMDAFLVTLFQIMTETPQMTPTEVIERTNEKGILLAPTVGRQQSEYLGPLIDRELDLLFQLRLLPPMPAVMREAMGHYRHSPIYTSPIARAMRAQEAAGFIRTVESVKELVNITGDASLLDPFDFDTAIPQIAQIQGVPESWMADARMIAGKRQNRGAAQQRQEQIQALPAQAAMLKAQNTVSKNQPGVSPTGAQPMLGPPQGTRQMNLGAA